MPVMSDTLRQAYLATDYRVRLARGGWASIRIGQTLPTALRDVLPQADAPWAFVTAWNPRSDKSSARANRTRQRKLLAALRQQSPAKLMPGIGIATDPHWREPSLFVAGIPLVKLDSLMQTFRQHAIVCGHGGQPAQLHWLDTP